MTTDAETLLALADHWAAFCDGDRADIPLSFEDDMEAAGLIELVPVTPDALEDAFAAERGIEAGGMMWQLTEAGARALAGRAE